MLIFFQPGVDPKIEPPEEVKQLIADGKAVLVTTWEELLAKHQELLPKCGGESPHLRYVEKR